MLSHFALAFICLIYAGHGGHAQTLVHTGHEPEISERHNSETCPETSKDSVKFIQHRVEVGKDMASSSVLKMEIDPLKDGADKRLGDVLPDDQQMEEDVLLLLQPRLQPQINTSQAKNFGIVDHQPQVQPWWSPWSLSVEQPVGPETNLQDGPSVLRDSTPIPDCGKSEGMRTMAGCCSGIQQELRELRGRGYWMSEADEDMWQLKGEKEFATLKVGSVNCLLTLKALTKFKTNILQQLDRLSGSTPAQTKEAMTKSILKPASLPKDIQMEGNPLHDVRRIGHCRYRPDVTQFQQTKTTRAQRKMSFAQWLAGRNPTREDGKQISWNEYVEYDDGDTACPECLAEVIANARQRVQDAMQCWWDLVIGGNLPDAEWEGLQEDLAQDVTNKVLELFNLGGIELDWIKDVPQAALSDFSMGNVDPFGGEVEGIATTLGFLIKKLFKQNLKRPLTRENQEAIHDGCLALFSSIAVTVVQYAVKVLDVSYNKVGEKVINNGVAWKINGHLQQVASGKGAHDWWHAIGNSMGQGQLSTSVHMSGELAALGLGGLVGAGISLVDQAWLKEEEVTTCQLLATVSKVMVASMFGFLGLVVGGGIALPAAMSGLTTALVGSPLQTILVATAVPLSKLGSVQLGNLLWTSMGQVVGKMFPDSPVMLQCAAGVTFTGQSRDVDDQREVFNVNFDGGRIQRGGVTQGRVRNAGEYSHANQESHLGWRTRGAPQNRSVGSGQPSILRPGCGH